MIKLKHYMPAKLGKSPDIREEHFQHPKDALERLADAARYGVMTGRRVVVEPGVAGGLPSVFMDGGEKIVEAA